jgi:hypothetical protein
MASYHEKKLKEYELTEEFQKSQEEIYFLWIQLHKSHLKEACENKVWRIIACHADTNLESLHDQIIGPAMGWRRHYHGYKFVVPTSGVVFAPPRADAINMMHINDYVLDVDKYDLRHVLRKIVKRLHYVYDLGEVWRHDITLIWKIERGATISLDFFTKYKKFVQDALGSRGTEEWTLQVNTSQLFAGAIDCPPEDSNGCHGTNNYGSILKRGRRY